MEELKPEIKIKSIDQLIPYANNSRTHTADQIAEIASSIKEFGFTNPVLLDKDNGVIAGHGRIYAAKLLGLKEVPTISLEHLTEAQKKAYIIADNRIAMKAGWNDEMLAIEISRLRELDYDLKFTGLTDEDIERIEVDVERLPDGDEDEVPELKIEATTKLGDVWILGKHRLMCGDSTSIDAVDKLMMGEKADMVFTDPPYGIDENTWRSSRDSKNVKGGRYEKIIGDTSTQTAIDAYNLCESLKIPIMVFWGANYYSHALPESANWLVWDKRVEERQNDDNSDAELAWVKSKYNSVRIFRHLWKGMVKGSEHGEARCHPTQKPIALAQWCFDYYGKDAKNVIDLFGGSGSTLIACEKTNRKCFMLELSPAYCDVIIKRFQQFSVKKAIHEQSQKTFDEISPLI